MIDSDSLMIISLRIVLMLFALQVITWSIGGAFKLLRGDTSVLPWYRLGVFLASSGVFIAQIRYLLENPWDDSPFVLLNGLVFLFSMMVFSWGNRLNEALGLEKLWWVIHPQNIEVATAMALLNQVDPEAAQKLAKTARELLADSSESNLSDV